MTGLRTGNAGSGIILSRSELQSFRGQRVPDVLGERPQLLLVGINPGLRSAAVQAPFGRRGNRFYPALYQAGIVDRVIDASDGLLEGDRAHLIAQRVGITTLVEGATARADELSPHQLTEGAHLLRRRIHTLGPKVVAMLGVTSYRIAFARPGATVGRQVEDLEGAELWVVPNPSGLNAHETVASLAAAYREVAVAAGISLYPPKPALQKSDAS
jgi:TDG/mug DNA glycosylase family protein